MPAYLLMEAVVSDNTTEHDFIKLTGLTVPEIRDSVIAFATDLHEQGYTAFEPAKYDFTEANLTALQQGIESNLALLLNENLYLKRVFGIGA